MVVAGVGKHKAKTEQKKKKKKRKRGHVRISWQPCNYHDSLHRWVAPPVDNSTRWLIRCWQNSHKPTLLWTEAQQRASGFFLSQVSWHPDAETDFPDECWRPHCFWTAALALPGCGNASKGWSVKVMAKKKQVARQRVEKLDQKQMRMRKGRKNGRMFVSMKCKHEHSFVSHVNMQNALQNRNHS